MSFYHGKGLQMHRKQHIENQLKILKQYRNATPDPRAPRELVSQLREESAHTLRDRRAALRAERVSPPMPNKGDF